ncbi:hypothetical protein KIW84_023175 [Lathyrus oleraceus]|uniref:Putative plant transposon protein domain-containing protein n=1 Tax=Pisum sativum TaxID=3888 RepID=A0A9D4YCA2_PEA|nr:hypothetical protein KIW84_023175 [Pisum sativum]
MALRVSFLVSPCFSARLSLFFHIFIVSTLVSSLTTLTTSPYDESQRASNDDYADVIELVSWVRGKKIDFGWQNINRVLKCKFRESHCRFHKMKGSSRSGWPFNDMRQLLVQSDKDWQPVEKQTPSKMLVVDISPISMALAYYMHHTLDTYKNGSDLIVERAFTLYFLLKRQPGNIGRIIAGDVDVIAQSSKKSLGYATVILLLCQKAGVDEVDGWKMLNPSQSLNPAWLRENTVARMEQRPTRRPHADEAGPCDPPRGVPMETPSIADEDSQTHFYRMTSQSFRDRFVGDPQAPHYGCYRYSRIKTLIQLGGPVPQQPMTKQSPFQQSPHQQKTPQRQSRLMSPISSFVHGGQGNDTTAFIDFDANMQDKDDNDAT